MVEGLIPLPMRPGLGVELNRSALRKFKDAAERVISTTVTVG
jgi:L-alanine-DL-glutamate epimerase-like enolase superfamily enzyme